MKSLLSLGVENLNIGQEMTLDYMEEIYLLFKLETSKMPPILFMNINRHIVNLDLNRVNYGQKVHYV